MADCLEGAALIRRIQHYRLWEVGENIEQWIPIGLRVAGFRVWGFRVLGFRVLGFRVLGFRVLGFGF